MAKDAGAASASDGLRKILGELAQLSALPGADLQFMSGLQASIVGFLRQSAGGQGGTPGPQGAPGQPQAGPPMGVPGASGLDLSAIMGGGPQGQSPTMPGASPDGVNADEMQRLMAAAGAK